jgi:mutator protein MutT
MKPVTLLFLLRDNEILLAMKKRGFGEGRWNGVGGKIEPGETIEEATARECHEEIGVRPGELEKVAHLTFAFPDDTPDILAHVYITTEWEGEPIETEEMAPRWFALGDIPYHEMWQDDEFWLPHVLAGKKLVASFMFTQDETMLPEKTKIEIVGEVPDAV